MKVVFRKFIPLILHKLLYYLIILIIIYVVNSCYFQLLYIFNTHKDV